MRCAQRLSKRYARSFNFALPRIPLPRLAFLAAAPYSSLAVPEQHVTYRQEPPPPSTNTAPPLIPSTASFFVSSTPNPSFLLRADTCSPHSSLRFPRLTPSSPPSPCGLSPPRNDQPYSLSHSGIRANVTQGTSKASTQENTEKPRRPSNAPCGPRRHKTSGVTRGDSGTEGVGWAISWTPRGNSPGPPGRRSKCDPRRLRNSHQPHAAQPHTTRHPGRELSPVGGTAERRGGATGVEGARQRVLEGARGLGPERDLRQAAGEHRERGPVAEPAGRGAAAGVCPPRQSAADPALQTLPVTLGRPHAEGRWAVLSERAAISLVTPAAESLETRSNDREREMNSFSRFDGEG